MVESYDTDNIYRILEMHILSRSVDIFFLRTFVR